MAETSAAGRRERSVETRPIDRFGVLDSQPVQIMSLGAAGAADIARVTGVSAAVARKIVSARRRRRLESLDDLATLGLRLQDVERLRRSAVFADDVRVFITDVPP